MPNSLQDTIDFIRPFCRYQRADIGANGQPIIGIASNVRNMILAAPFTWDFNRSENQDITTVQGQQDYPSTIDDFGFLEKASLLDENNIWKEFDDVQNNEPLAKSSTQARPSVIATQGFANAPQVSDVVKKAFTFADYTNPATFSFTVPVSVAIGDTLVFVFETSNGSGDATVTADSLGNVITQISSQQGGGGGGDLHQFQIFNMPVTVAGTSVITPTLLSNRNVLVQALLLTGVGTIITTSPVNNTGTSAGWPSVTLNTTQDYTLMVAFDAAYAPPAAIAGVVPFTGLLSGIIPDSTPSNVQIDTAVQMALIAGPYNASFSQASSAEWLTVLVGYPVNSTVGTNAPVFRFSAVPDAVYPINLVYQVVAESFTNTIDLWSPIPDSFSDVYNNLVLGYYMESCQDPRGPQYIAKGIAGLLARAGGLSETDRAVFAASYMTYQQAQAVAALRPQQSIQAEGGR